MSLIKYVGMQIDGGDVGVEFPNKTILFVRGRLNEHFLYVMESLLARDTSGYYSDLDSHAGKLYSDIDGHLVMLFNDGAIQSNERVIQVSGVLPSIHVVRYIGVGTTFRSFHLESSLSTYSTVYSDMRKYSHVIDDAKWVRLISVVNDLLGFEFVKLEDEKLSFSPSADCKFSIEAQKFVYMLMAECYLTPDGFRRILLLSDIPFLEKEDEVKFINKLCAIPGASLTLSTSEVGTSDIEPYNSMSFLSV